MRYLVFATGPQGLGKQGGELRQRLALLLSGELRERIEVYPCETYAELLAAVEKGTASLAWLPPALCVQAAERDAVTVLARSLRPGGRSYRGAIFVPSISSIRRVSDLAGKKVGWVDPDSCSGHLFPRAALREGGLEPDAQLAEQRFLGSHAAVARAVASGEVDAGATFVHLGEKGAIVGAGWHAVAKVGFRTIAVTEEVPTDSVCATYALPAELVGRTREALASLGSSADGRLVLEALFQCVGFEPATLDHYARLRDLRA